MTTVDAVALAALATMTTVAATGTMTIATAGIEAVETVVAIGTKTTATAMGIETGETVVATAMMTAIAEAGGGGTCAFYESEKHVHDDFTSSFSRVSPNPLERSRDARDDDRDRPHVHMSVAVLKDAASTNRTVEQTSQSAYVPGGVAEVRTGTAFLMLWAVDYIMYTCQRCHTYLV